MELKFETLKYQQDAVQAVVRLFEGQTRSHSIYSAQSSNLFGVIANQLSLDWDTVGQNLNAVQRDFGQPETEIGQYGLNFSVEMETGTGKTYVYLRTILELNRCYGWKKFVIVVPSVAIREGVLHSLAATKTHFDGVFNKPLIHFFEYKRERLSSLKAFSESNGIEIMVINIDSFSKDENVINIVRENGSAPIQYIQATCPIVIIDEPQNMETEKRLQAIKSLNPLFTLRYSATHKEVRHKLYSLNPVQAYQQKLVKQIEVCSVLAENDVNGAFVQLVEVKQASKGKLEAIVNIYKRGKSETKTEKVKIQKDDDLFDKSGGNPAYRTGFIVNGLNYTDQQIIFSDGQIIGKDSATDMHDEIMKMQIRQTIAEHLKKEKKLNVLGIKVLSLFFIDKVDNYRNGGKFYRWFDEIYRELSGEDSDGVHNGYFSQDKNGQWKDTGKAEADFDVYHLIMKDKETLLSLDNPLRFIFSHSALKEGWDNPNVFQICTLNETRSPIKKRQEIGRGLRLPVNRYGERVRDDSVNILTIVPNESYESFAENLQKEYQDECGITFHADFIRNGRDRQTLKYQKGFELNEAFLAIWEKLKQKTRYRVAFDSKELIEQAAQAVNNMPAIQRVKIRVQKAAIDQSMTYGVEAAATSDYGYDVENIWQIPDLIGELVTKTGLTRKSVYEILQKSERLDDVERNPQRFIDLAAQAVNRALHSLMVKGIVYRKCEDEFYEMNLLQEGEFYQSVHDFFVKNMEKTIHEGCIPLDSATENRFARDCENNEAVLLYFKLPKKFKIPTPIEDYNPDWAVVMKAQNGKQEKIYFVAETKNTGEGIQSGVDLALLREKEQLKIHYANRHFAAFDDVNYQVVEKLSQLEY